ncbi:MAG: hypothetical protein JRF70_12875, partial [Deltaproteobacteria bacterium]|nr:hypothetical protein [Deltaproteobacteria bacterium]
MPGLSSNALRVLEARYLLRDEAGRRLEDWGGLCRRVAGGVAAAETAFGGDPEPVAERFARLLQERVFLPNSPTLMNAGTPLGQLAACFVLPIPDDLTGIFEAVKRMAVIHQSGGGTGFDFSRLRPAGDPVARSHGVASGPVSFIEVFDATTSVIKQGGRRRGANMGVLRMDHPDVRAFVAAKSAPHQLQSLPGRGRRLLPRRRSGRQLRPGPSPGRQGRGEPAGGRPAGRGGGPRLGGRGPGPDLRGCGEPGEPDARSGPHGGHQPLRRAAAAGERGLQ